MSDTMKTRDRKPVSRASWNFWVDIATAVVFSAMVGTGILAKWILPPGSRGGEGLVWLGEGRHFWGDIHFWLGITMLTLIIVHIWLHWSWVLVTWRRLIGSIRSPVTWVAILVILALLLLPLIVPRQFSQSYLEEHELQEEQAEKIYETMLEE